MIVCYLKIEIFVIADRDHAADHAVNQDPGPDPGPVHVMDPTGLLRQTITKPKTKTPTNLRSEKNSNNDNPSFISFGFFRDGDWSIILFFEAFLFPLVSKFVS